VLSLVLNLDPRANLAAPVNRRSAVNSLLDEAARAVEGEEGLSHDSHIALRADVPRVREALDENLDDDWAEGAHALALFVSGPADLFEVVRLPRPAGNRVVIAPRPALQTLAEAVTAGRLGVLVFDGDDARLFESHGERLEQIDAASEHHRGRSAHGGTIGTRYERPVGMEELEFLRGVAGLLRDADAREGFTRIVVGASERHVGEFRRMLDPHLADRIIGRFDAGADWEAPQELREKIEPLLRADDTRREADLLERAARSGVRGLTDTLPALYERRVATLLLEPGVQHAGVVCPRCGWAAADERGDCPVDGEPMVPEANIVEWAIRMAVVQDAESLPVRHHNDLVEHDGIAAALRF
jgi:peptide subunit release factor 1 (eRF1)